MKNGSGSCRRREFTMMGMMYAAVIAFYVAVFSTFFSVNSMDIWSDPDIRFEQLLFVDTFLFGSIYGFKTCDRKIDLLSIPQLRRRLTNPPWIRLRHAFPLRAGIFLPFSKDRSWRSQPRDPDIASPAYSRLIFINIFLFRIILRVVSLYF